VSTATAPDSKGECLSTRRCGTDASFGVFGERLGVGGCELDASVAPRRLGRLSARFIWPPTKCRGHDARVLLIPDWIELANRVGLPAGTCAFTVRKSRVLSQLVEACLGGLRKRLCVSRLGGWMFVVGLMPIMSRSRARKWRRDARDMRRLIGLKE
jgi:hypothetical protein